MNEGKELEGAEIQLPEKEYGKWVKPLRNLSRLVPGGIWVGGVALGVELAARRPDLSSQFFQPSGPNDFDMLCPEDLLATLAKNLPRKVDSNEAGFVIVPTSIPEKYYLRVRDAQTGVCTDLIHLATDIPPYTTDKFQINNDVTVRTLSPEELYLQRLIQVTGYEEKWLKGKTHKPAQHHFVMLDQNALIVDEGKLTALFPNFKSRVYTIYGANLHEMTWEELRNVAKDLR